MLNILAGLLLSVLVIALSVRSSAAQEPVPSASAVKPHAGEGEPAIKSGIEGYQTNGRWREGTRLHHVQGVFSSIGDRLQFTTSDGKVQILVTENLLAERVMRSTQESSDPLAWTVQGTMTEFKGNNFLTLNYATILAKKPKLAAKEATADANRLSQ